MEKLPRQTYTKEFREQALSINLTILTLALTLGVGIAIWMLFNKPVVSYEFNADTGVLECTDASLLRKPTQHVVLFTSLSSIQIHRHEQYTFTSIEECNSIYGQIICLDINGNKFFIGNLP